ncbi:MAG: carbohydrate transporter ATP-binding protein family [Acidimicrobiales bacterium]|nr:carbohydrate transporter ATP-binding protein family [Acidimicrobiales bacterium]
MASVAFEHVTKRFGDVVAVEDLDLHVDDREFLVLLGPSGCGKSTALRMIAGLEEPTEGAIRIGEHRVDGVDPKDRDLAMVFQSYALYPHKSVRQNIEFPLRSRKVPPAERTQLVQDAAGQLGLSTLLDRKPRELSGGQRQRVALARAIVRRPAVFLMDEPLSNLDANMRTATRAELVELHQRLGTTFVYVTHDQVEAMTMATRVAVMSEGSLQQLGVPQEVYDRPANVFVAQFIGSPPMNVVPGPVAAPLGVGRDDVVVGIRPEHLMIGTAGISAIVRVVESLGHERHVLCEADGHRLIVRCPAHGDAPVEGDAVHLSARPEHLHLFDASSGQRVA